MASKASVDPPHYKRLLYLSKMTGMPIFYREDLTKHDKRYLAKYRPRNFLWGVGESGTDIVALETQKERPINAYLWESSFFAATIKNNPGHCQKIFHITGRTYKEITRKQALRLLLRNLPSESQLGGDKEAVKNVSKVRKQLNEVYQKL